MGLPDLGGLGHPRRRGSGVSIMGIRDTSDHGHPGLRGSEASETLRIWGLGQGHPRHRVWASVTLQNRDILDYGDHGHPR